jgi:hypothetical protein
MNHDITWCVSNECEVKQRCYRHIDRCNTNTRISLCDFHKAGTCTDKQYIHSNSSYPTIDVIKQLIKLPDLLEHISREYSGSKLDHYIVQMILTEIGDCVDNYIAEGDIHRKFRQETTEFVIGSISISNIPLTSLIRRKNI